MSRYRKLVLLLLIVCGLSLINAVAIDDFKDAISKTEGDATAITAIIQEYLPQFKTVEELRELQNVWQQTDKEASSAYFCKASYKNPD
ncbi:MAG: hypothetical protein WCT23_09385 [Candidatus Neomarinimicrobiota bacterium]